MCACPFILSPDLPGKALSLFAAHRRAGHGAAADEQQREPKPKTAAFAGLRRLRQLFFHGIRLGDLFRRRRVGKILAAAAAVPVLNIARGLLARRLCGDML